MNLFISFEGPDGSGKTTVTEGVCAYFKNKGVSVMLTREPGGIEISEKIREIILNPEHKAMDDRTEALLYAASRRQHLIEKVIPALSAGTMVICDRFVDSSLAYQGYARGLGIEEVLEINNFAIEDQFPDLTIFLDIKPEISLKRVDNRGQKDRLEQETLKFHEKVYRGYEKVRELFGDRIISVDATMREEEVLKAVIGVIEGFINDKENRI